MNGTRNRAGLMATGIPADRMRETTAPTGRPHPLLTDDEAREHSEHREAGMSALVAALPAAVDTALRKVAPEQYSPETAAQIAADAAARLTSNPLPASDVCHVYPGLCDRKDGEDGDQVGADGRHFDHGGSTITVPSGDCPDDPVIWAEFVHVSGGTPKIGFPGERDLSPQQARVKAQQLHAFADALTTLADQVEVYR
ncbi:hypothetical protein AB0F77_20970 [Streptomyces sp. NPDC026672]|uniref:hypothetical protein n=1 Tax=unclassified Streptomyces TaxID=2593676 RepID=UPI0033F71765